MLTAFFSFNNEFIQKNFKYTCIDHIFKYFNFFVLLKEFPVTYKIDVKPDLVFIIHRPFSQVINIDGLILMTTDFKSP